MCNSKIYWTIKLTLLFYGNIKTTYSWVNKYSVPFSERNDMAHTEG